MIDVLVFDFDGADRSIVSQMMQGLVEKQSDADGTDGLLRDTFTALSVRRLGVDATGLRARVAGSVRLQRSNRRVAYSAPHLESAIFFVGCFQKWGGQQERCGPYDDRGKTTNQIETLVLLGISLGAAGINCALVAVDYWETVANVLIIAGACYAFVIQRFEAKAGPEP